MEPLTGFFFLEGLTFDIIGAILIITGLFPTQFRDQPIANEIIQRVKNKKDILSHFEQERLQINRVHTKTFDPNLKQAHEKQLKYFDQKILEATHDLEQVQTNTNAAALNYIIHLNHNNAFNRGIRGLPFLIGGFSLQGIAVIIQLI